jgi:MFS family permease
MGLTTASHGLVHLYEGVLPPLIPLLMGVFHTDYFHLGLVVTVFSYAFGLGSFPAGFLADRIGPRRLVTAYLFGSGFFAVLIFSSGSLTSYAVLMGFVGLFCSTYHPASNTLISHTIREKGTAFGLHGIAGSLGVALAPVLSAWIGTAAGWKAPHVLFGLFGLGVGLYSLTLGTPTPGPVAEGAHHPQKTEGEPRSISYVNLAIFLASATSLGLTYKGIMTFLPSYMGESVHLSFLRLDTVSMGGTIATVALLSGALGQYLAGRLVDRYQPEKIYLVAVLLGTLFVFVMALSSDILLILSAVFYALAYFSTQPTQNYLLSKYLPKHRQGLGYGLHFSLTFGVGSTSAAFSGYLADRFGLQSVFYAMGLCFVVSSVLILVLLKRSGGRVQGM